MTRSELTNLSGVYVSRETFDKLRCLVTLVSIESTKQNLISKASLDDIWLRHVADSLQLVKFGNDLSPWLDIGTGAGFPGLAIAVLNLTHVVLVEERRLRFEFLSAAAHELGLNNVTIIHSKIERVQSFNAGVISARAFAPLGKILELSLRFCSKETRLLLPKGKNAASELASVGTMWHCNFRLEPSVTDPKSSIIIVDRVAKGANPT